MLRLISMLMIIGCHICQHYGNVMAFWLNVGVQVFFIISGFLYGQKELVNYFGWFWKQFKKIVVIYYLFILFVIVLLRLFHPECLSLYNIITSILGIGTLHGFGHLWFVGYIVFCYLITPILQYLCHFLLSVKKQRIFIILMGLVCMYQIYASLLNMHFMPARVLCYVAGYMLGFFYFRKGEILFRSTIRWFILLGFSSNILYIMLKYVFLRDIPILGVLYGYSHLFLGGMIFLLGYKLFENIRRNTLLEFSDRYSYAIYIVHGTFALSAFNVLDINIPLCVKIILVYGLSIACGYCLKKLEDAVLKVMSI